MCADLGARAVYNTTQTLPGVPRHSARDVIPPAAATICKIRVTRGFLGEARDVIEAEKDEQVYFARANYAAFTSRTKAERAALAVELAAKKARKSGPKASKSRLG